MIERTWGRPARSLPTGLAVCLALCLSLLANGAQAKEKDAAGPYGMTRRVLVGGIFGHGDRVKSEGGKPIGEDSGSQIIFHMEGGLFTHQSVLGNVAGLSGGMQMGWDGIPNGGDDSLMGDLLGMHFDFWVGFPVSLFRYGSGKRDNFRLLFEPGFGTSFQHAYLYLKTRACVGLGDDMEGDISWTWWPGATSATAAGPKGDGNNVASLRTTVYLGGDTAFFGWGEYLTSQREHDDFSQTNSAQFDKQNPFGTTRRRDFESIFRVGLGAAF